MLIEITDGVPVGLATGQVIGNLNEVLLKNQAKITVMFKDRLYLIHVDEQYFA